MSTEPGPPPKKLRAFVAVEIDEDLRARIGELMKELRREVRGVRWVGPEGLHLTLRFLGYAAAAALVQVQGALAEAAAACPPADVPVGGLGMFPEQGSPRVLWLALDVPATIRELQQKCERAALEAGFPAEPRAFRPHLTLGRWSEPARRPRLPPVDLGTARLDRLVLFRSELKRTGAVYTPLAAFPLGGAGSSLR